MEEAHRFPRKLDDVGSSDLWTDGCMTQEGFVLDQIQVFEKKPKVVEAPVEP